jgi:hypothetical protein
MMTVYDFESPLYFGSAILLLLLLSAYIVAIIMRKRRQQRQRLKGLLAPVSREEVRAIIIPDGIGGMIEIDRLILTDHGLLILETYPMSGHLFGSDHIEQWTQIIDGRSFKFTNPLHHLNNVKQAIKVLAPKVPVFVRVIFTEDSNFPKGKPEVVSTLNTLEQDLLALTTKPNRAEQANQAWERILRIGRQDGQAIVRENSGT